jgi:REP element-mobilizing transposase RayT
MKQIEFFKKSEKAFGGTLMKKAKGRATPRPLSTRDNMHLVLRSSKAVGDWSFKGKRNEFRIQSIIKKFSVKYGVRVISLANVGNHLHFQIKLTNRYTYNPFIRAMTAAIAMAVTGSSRWNPLKKEAKFWDYRPFTRIIRGFRSLLNLQDYIRVNQLEGYGNTRQQARLILAALNDRMNL